jgi:hypothetical protein
VSERPASRPRDEGIRPAVSNRPSRRRRGGGHEGTVTAGVDRRGTAGTRGAPPVIARMRDRFELVAVGDVDPGPAETGSAVWRSRPAHTRAVGTPPFLPAARKGPDEEPPGTDPLHPDTKGAGPRLPLPDRLARSFPFYRGLRVGNPHGATLALAEGAARLTPGAGVLPGVSGGVEHPQDRPSADLGQPIGCLSQRAL